jgi:polyisoprenoid-binding protein YceI
VFVILLYTTFVYTTNIKTSKNETMKMKFLSMASIALLAGVTLSSCGGNTTEASTEESAVEAEVKSSNVSLENSSVTWKGTMLGVYAHEGTVQLTQGTIETKGNEISGGSFTVDLSSIHPTDENYDAKQDRTPENLVGHLQSPEFFDVANHPNATFQITGSNGGVVTGNLTVRGITNEETVQNVVYNEVSNSWSGTMTFDRKKYDVAWDSQMKEMVLSNDIELNINLSL